MHVQGSPHVTHIPGPLASAMTSSLELASGSATATEIIGHSPADAATEVLGSLASEGRITSEVPPHHVETG